MARSLFFYGTLCHVPLLEIVLGRPAPSLQVTPAGLADHAVRSVAEGPFPTIVAEPGKTAEGLLVEGLEPQDIARLDHYEGAFAYDLTRVTLTNGVVAEVYFPQPGLWTPTDPWRLADWERACGPLTCFAAGEVMGYFGQKKAEQVAEIFPMIRMRAAARVNAQHSLHGEGTLAGKIDVVRRERMYGGYFALDEYRLRHELFDGGMSETVERTIFVAADAALVLPYDPVRDRVLLVEQMRMGPLARGEAAVWQYEPIAGRIDGGETPQDAAHREAMEEAGIRLTALEPVAEVYASPGDSTGFFYIYVGIADLPDQVTGVGGEAAEHEDIRSHLMSFDDLMTWCDTRRAANAPVALVAYWLARHRTRLRLAGGAATPEAT